MLLAHLSCARRAPRGLAFQWAPTLGGECYTEFMCAVEEAMRCFNGHPLLGVNATLWGKDAKVAVRYSMFQWAPTLGGECYKTPTPKTAIRSRRSFNWHPPLGVNATCIFRSCKWRLLCGFNGHPPLGVNATSDWSARIGCQRVFCFNGHPPLGVNATACSAVRVGRSLKSFNGHPPLGVNATGAGVLHPRIQRMEVSVGTHPWG